MKVYTYEEISLITLSSFGELSYANKRRLLSDLDSAEPDFKNNEKFLIKTLGDSVYNKVRAKFFDKAYRKKFLDELAVKGIQCVTYFSEEYPESLKNIGAPPITLYCKGDVSLMKTNCFAIVGSRRTLPKSLAECENISGELSKTFTVVSGAADGADSAALKGALDCGGKVISVLANGFDYTYPASSAAYRARIEKCGLLISEYPPDVKPQAYYFPIRNRIIAGLARGTLVVSAAEKSGALITARYALEYDREVFAFPYNSGIFSGSGCNRLIKEGAHLTENILDILTEFGLDFNTPEQVRLSDEELSVYNYLKESGEEFLAIIAQKSGKQLREILPLIVSLEMKGLIVSVGGNKYAIVNR